MKAKAVYEAFVAQKPNTTLQLSSDVFSYLSITEVFATYGLVLIAWLLMESLRRWDP